MTFCEELDITFYLKFYDPQPGCHYETSIGQYKHNQSTREAAEELVRNKCKQTNFYKVEMSLCYFRNGSSKIMGNAAQRTSVDSHCYPKATISDHVMSMVRRYPLTK